MKPITRLLTCFLCLVGFVPLAAGQGLATAAPEQVGLSSERLQRIRPFMQAYVDQNKLAGLITMIARRGKVVHFERFGLRDKATQKPMQSDTIFRLYSMTKPIISVALMMLYEEGRFQLDDPIAKFIPAFKNLQVLVHASDRGLTVTAPRREVSIRHLLTHTAGFTYDNSKEPVDVLYREANLQSGETTLREFIRQLSKLPLRHHPGEDFQYGVAVDVQGYLIEVISGMKLDTFLEQRIFQPLGIKDTGFGVPDNKKDRFATLYGRDAQGGLGVIVGPPLIRYQQPVKFLSGSGGLVATASDYMRFAQMMLNGGELDGVRILSRKTVELMTTNHLPETILPFRVGANVMKGYGFGLGVRVLQNVAESAVPGSVGEYGWGGLASTYFWVDPTEEMIGLILTQLIPSRTYPIRNEFRVLAYQAIVD